MTGAAWAAVFPPLLALMTPPACQIIVLAVPGVIGWAWVAERTRTRPRTAVYRSARPRANWPALPLLGALPRRVALSYIVVVSRPTTG